MTHAEWLACNLCSEWHCEQHAIRGTSGTLLRQELAIVLLRSVVQSGVTIPNTPLPADIPPSGWTELAEAVRFVMDRNAMFAPGGQFRPTESVTPAEFNHAIATILGVGGIGTAGDRVNRIAAAEHLARMLPRCLNPDYMTHGINQSSNFLLFPDISMRHPQWHGLVTELAHDHSFYWQGTAGSREVWTIGFHPW